MLVVLLNFVIAIVSEVYDDVMDRREYFIYSERIQLNNEASSFYAFISDIGLKKQNKID